MNIYIYTPNFDDKFLIEYAESIIFSKKLKDIGTFEVKIPNLHNQQLDAITTGYYIRPSYDDSDFFIIKEIEYTYSNTDGNYIYLRGEELKAQFKQRIIVGQKNLSSNILNNCRELTNYINTYYPFESEIYVEEYNDSILYQFQFDFENLYNALKTMTDTADMFFDVYLNENTSNFNMYLFKYILKTDTIFSIEFNNMLSFTEKIDSYDSCDIAIVVGEGSGTSKRYQIVGSTSTSNTSVYNKVDATDISSNSGVITETEYNNFLINQGMAYIKDNQLTTTYELNVDTKLYKYKKDFFIGALVTVINPISNLELYGLVTEVTEKWDIDGYGCDIKLEIVNI